MKIEKLLESWAETADELLQDLRRFEHLQQKFGRQYQLSLTLFLYAVSDEEIRCVLEAEDKHAAALSLLSEKVNRW